MRHREHDTENQGESEQQNGEVRFNFWHTHGKAVLSKTQSAPGDTVEIDGEYTLCERAQRGKRLAEKAQHATTAQRDPTGEVCVVQARTAYQSGTHSMFSRYERYNRAAHSTALTCPPASFTHHLTLAHRNSSSGEQGEEETVPNFPSRCATAPLSLSSI